MGVVGAFRDITWRKQAEAELKQANQYMENIFDNSAEAIGIVDSNRACQEMEQGLRKKSMDILLKSCRGNRSFDLYADKDELANMLIQLRQDGYVKELRN